MKKYISLMIVLALFVSVLSACSSGRNIDPEYRKVGEAGLGLAQAYLDGRVDLDTAKEKAERIRADLDALPLLPEASKDFKDSEAVSLRVSSICFSLFLQRPEDSTDELVATLSKLSESLSKILYGE